MTLTPRTLWVVLVGTAAGIVAVLMPFLLPLTPPCKLPWPWHVALACIGVALGGALPTLIARGWSRPQRAVLVASGLSAALCLAVLWPAYIKNQESLKPGYHDPARDAIFWSNRDGAFFGQIAFQLLCVLGCTAYSARQEGTETKPESNAG